jgi:hypothetical protein
MMMMNLDLWEDISPADDISFIDPYKQSGRWNNVLDWVSSMKATP